MLHRTSAGLLVLAAVPAFLAFPTLTTPTPAPHPVDARLAHLSLPLTPLAARAADGNPAEVRAAASGPVVDTGMRATTRFVGLGVTWKPGTTVRGLTVKVRVHHDGSWGAWDSLDALDALAAGDGPVTPQRQGTEPLLTDPADGVQAQVFSPSGAVPADLRLDLIDPGTSSADAHLRGSQPSASAAAASSQPAIITRAQWGANESYRGTPRYSGTVKAAIIHHTATTNDYSASAAAAQIRAVYAYHTRTLGWSDIGYQFLVDKYGSLYEGRAGGLDGATIGAHTAGFNVDTFAVSALGNFDTAPASSAMVESISRLVAWKLTIHHRDPLGRAALTASGGTASLTRYANGVTVSLPTIFTHRDAGWTACPGANLFAAVPRVKARVSQLMGSMIYDPAVSASSAVTPGGSPITVTGRTDSDRGWTGTITSAATGGTVRTLRGVTSGRAFSGTWDLLDSAGRQLPPGAYDLIVTSGDALPVTIRATLKDQAPVVVPGAGSTSPTGPVPPLNSVYTTQSTAHTVNGRLWRTRCEPYGGAGATRCWTDIVATTTTKKATQGFTTTKGWTFNNLTYRDWDRPSWATNVLSTNGEHLSAGRRWKTTCSTATAGWRSCSSSIWATVVSRQSTSKGYVYRQYLTWKFNNMAWLRVAA